MLPPLPSALTRAAQAERQRAEQLRGRRDRLASEVAAATAACEQAECERKGLEVAVQVRVRYEAESRIGAVDGMTAL